MCSLPVFCYSPLHRALIQSICSPQPEVAVSPGEPPGESKKRREKRREEVDSSSCNGPPAALSTAEGIPQATSRFVGVRRAPRQRKAKSKHTASVNADAMGALIAFVQDLKVKGIAESSFEARSIEGKAKAAPSTSPPGASAPKEIRLL